MKIKNKKRLTKKVWVIKDKYWNEWEEIFTNERIARKIFKTLKSTHRYTLEKSKIYLYIGDATTNSEEPF